MEQKMAKGAGLTPQQKQFLDIAISDKYFLDTFYLSGGTSLSSWYLHHRESNDLDFFSLKPFEYDRIIRWFHQNKQKIGYKYDRFDEDYGFLAVSLRFPDDTFLLIDFHFYSRTKLIRGILWQGLEIDSLYDITVNKIDTLASNPRTRDFVDIYFILKQKDSPTLQKIILDVEKKFPEKIDTLDLAKNFAKASEYTDYPKMLVPFDPQEMNKFFENLAIQLKPKIFKSKR